MKRLFVVNRTGDPPAVPLFAPLFLFTAAVEITGGNTLAAEFPLFCFLKSWLKNSEVVFTF